MELPIYGLDPTEVIEAMPAGSWGQDSPPRTWQLYADATRATRHPLTYSFVPNLAWLPKVDLAA